MKCKKLILVALVVALTLSLGIPAILAADSTSTEIKGEYKAPVIDVIVMPEGSAQLNPYAMPVKALDSTGVQIGTKTLKTTGQIATQPLAMYNKTDVELSVGATVSATNINGVELVTKPFRATETDKQALIYLEAKQSATLGASDYFVATDTNPTPGAGYIGTIDGEKLVDEFNLWQKTTYNAAATDQVLVDPKEPTTKKGLATMAAGTGTGPNTGSYVLYRLGGACVESPETAWAEGSSGDKFNVNVSFSFTPTNTGSNP